VVRRARRVGQLLVIDDGALEGSNRQTLQRAVRPLYRR
jgi:hypothetical protein